MNKSPIYCGTLGGMIMGVFPSLAVGDVLITILLASVGAIVSFFVSLVLGNLFKRKK